MIMYLRVGVFVIFFNLCLCAVENFVGFTAFNSAILSYENADPIVFDMTLVNKGLHYNTSTGVFTCPFNGIYYISTSFRKVGSSGRVQVIADVLVNGYVVLRMDDQSSYNSYAMVSSSALVRCESGQQISMVAMGTFSISGASPPVSTYTVMLVRQTETGADFVGVTAFKQDSQAYYGGEKIEFDGIVWSNGEDYQDSVFTCPTSGIYFISYQFQKFDAYDMYMDVVKNGSEVLLRTSDGHPNNRDSTRSNSGLVTCMSGETLSVKAYHTGAILGSPAPISTFTVIYAAGVGSPQPISTSKEIYVADVGVNAAVGFTGSKLVPDLLTIGQPIVFENILEKLGGSYDNNTGVFTCEADGIYYVAMNLQRSSYLDIEVELLRSTVTVPVVTMEDNSSNNNFGVLTITTLTPCLPGEQLTVTPYGGGGVQGSAYPVTTWTVILMHEF